MKEFLPFVLMKLIWLGAGLLVLGFVLMPIFKKANKATWKALVPFYNVFAWLKLTKNPWWLAILLLQPYFLPHWAICVTGAFILGKLLFDTYSLFKETHYYGLKLFGVLIFALVLFSGGFLANWESFAETAWVQKWSENLIFIFYGVFALGLIDLLMLGMGSAKFDFERYNNKEFSFQDYAIKQVKKNTIAYTSVYVLGILALVAVYADFIASDLPIYAKYRGEDIFPAYEYFFDKSAKITTVNPETGNDELLQYDIANWKQLDVEAVVWTPVPFSDESFDRYNREYAGPFETQRYKGPDGELKDVKFSFKDPNFKFRHHLGTTQPGQDLLAGLIHGSRISLTIGFISMGIASFIGIFLGSLAGFYGDFGATTSRLRFWWMLSGTVLGLFFWLETSLGVKGFLGALFVFQLIAYFILRHLEKGFLKTEVTVPVDSFVLRIIEVLNALPRLILIITISSVYDRSMVLLMVIIGVTSWTGIARFTRAEFLRTRSLDYIAAARSMGFSDLRVIFKHALPNSIAPVFVSIAFGIASAILIESGLSFLGIGVPDDVVTWGSLLNKGRIEFEAWWLVVFPGFAIFLTVTIYNMIGESLRDALDPRLKQ